MVYNFVANCLFLDFKNRLLEKFRRRPSMMTIASAESSSFLIEELPEDVPNGGRLLGEPRGRPTSAKPLHRSRTPNIVHVSAHDYNRINALKYLPGKRKFGCSEVKGKDDNGAMLKFPKKKGPETLSWMRKVEFGVSLITSDK